MNLKWVRLFLVSIISIISLTITGQSITSEEYTIDLGELYRADGKIIYTGKLKNSDTTLVSFKKAESILDEVEFKLEKKVFLPGEELKYTLVFDPVNSPEYLYNKVTLYFENGQLPLVLTMKGILIDGAFKDAVNYQIGHLGMKSSQMNFGFIYKGEIIKRKFPIINLSDKPVSLEITELPEYIDVLVNPVKLAPGEKSDIEVTYYTDATEAWDININKLVLKVEGKETEKGKLTVVANIREDFRNINKNGSNNYPQAIFDENNFDFDTINSGQQITYPFILKNKGNSDLVIRTIRATCAFSEVITEKTVIAPGEKSTIKVTLDSSNLEGYNESGVTIVTNDPVNYKQFLWMNGFIQ